VLDAIDKGALTAGDIKNGLNATRALLPEAEGTLPRVRHRPMILRLEILPNAVDDLCRLGYGIESFDRILSKMRRWLALPRRPRYRSELRSAGSTDIGGSGSSASLAPAGQIRANGMSPKICSVLPKALPCNARHLAPVPFIGRFAASRRRAGNRLRDITRSTR
jgi:hypothetical protein